MLVFELSAAFMVDGRWKDGVFCSVLGLGEVGHGGGIVRGEFDGGSLQHA